jgi:hypothetical protein
MADKILQPIVNIATKTMVAGYWKPMIQEHRK